LSRLVRDLFYKFDGAGGFLNLRWKRLKFISNLAVS